jgi:serine/threonine protein kinase
MEPREKGEALGEDAPKGEVLLGRYRIEALLGKGGFASTWAATELSSQKPVALKCLSLEQVDDWKSVELFEREAKVLSQLNHPGIPAYVAYHPPEEGVDGASFILVQELAAGTSLKKRLDEGWRPTEDEIRRVAAKTLEILAYLHCKNPPVVHRDVKPQNLLMDDDGKIRLVDFGAVRDSVASHTEAGSTVVGTYGYMAPEQFQGRAAPTSDLYGLGATLVHLLTGKMPADLPHERLKITFRDLVNLSPGFTQWLDRLLEPVEEDRFPTTQAALDALSRVDDAPLVSTETPVGTKVKLVRDGQHLFVHFPPQRRTSALPILGFTTIWMTIIGFWTFGSIDAGVPLGFTFLSLPFWFAGFALAASGLQLLFGSTDLRIDSKTFEVIRKIAGIAFRRRSGRAKDLRGLEMKETKRANQRTIRRLVLREGVRTHTLSDGLSYVEHEWLDEQLDVFLGDD